MIPAATLEKIHRAVEYALIHHEGQYRKYPSPVGSGEKAPYAVHPMRIVLTLILHVGVTDEAALCAAALHDVVEDTTVDFDDVAKRFGEEVATLVACMTKDKRLPEERREEEFLRQVAAAPLKARIVKLADLYDNLGDALSETVPADRRRNIARKKVPHVASLCASMPEEYRGFAAEVKARLERGLL